MWHHRRVSFGRLPRTMFALRRGALTVEEVEEKLRQNNVPEEDASATLNAVTRRLAGKKSA
jgi:hypothetical protein